MNRAERRRKQKAEGKTYALTGHDLAYRQGYQEGMMDAAYEQVGITIRIYTTAIMATLYNECGFGKKRMTRVLDHFTATIRRLYDDKSIEPRLREYVIQKTGIDPDDYTGSRKIDTIREIRAQKGMAPVVKPEEAAAVAEMVAKEIEGWK